MTKSKPVKQKKIEGLDRNRLFTPWNRVLPQNNQASLLIVIDKVNELVDLLNSREEKE